MIQFEVEILNFEQLTNRLLEYEQRFGYSTVEMFRRYLNGEYPHDDTIEGWFDLLFLYLGTDEIKKVL